MKTEDPKTIKALQAEIGRLKRRLERERQTRAQTELIAEQGFRDLYHQQKQWQLLQAIAVSANEALTSQDALQKALDEICAYLEWPIGHVYVIEEGTQQLVSNRLWHLADAEKFREFQEVSEQMSFP